MSTDPAGAVLQRRGEAPPVRAVHLGLGGFFRAHQAWYTHRAGADADGAPWGIAAWSGRRPDLAEALSAQGGLYTLLTRTADGDELQQVSSVSRACAAADHGAWLACLSSPAVRVVTTTVTEAGYVRGADGGLDRTAPAVLADAAALRSDPGAPVRTAPARLVAGLLARRRADAGPLALVPCDNLPRNGQVLARVLRDLAEVVDPTLPAWVDEQVSAVTTVVDRITPEPTAEDRAAVLAATGVHDRCPVATEPFSEWVLCGAFPGGRPAWEAAGATLTDDAEPFERRKLWLLNGAHSLLAYTGSARGHATVAEAVADPACRGWVEQWWDEACRHLALPAGAVAAYRAALVERFANPRLRHLLAQVAADGSVKLPLRVLPVLRAERDAGRTPSGAAHALAGWVAHLRGAGGPVRDPRAGALQALAAGPLPDAVRAVLGSLDAALADDGELVAAVAVAVGDLRQP